MKISRLALTTIFAVGLIGSAQGQQPLGIGTSGQGTATYSIGSAIAKVAGEKADVPIRVQPQGGTGKVVPLVNAGRLDFGLANILEVTNAVKGRGPFKDRANPNLKVVGVLYPFRVGLFVRKDSPAKTVADIKGMKIGSGYSSQRIIGILVNSVLANGGLTMDDMTQVPVVNIIQNADDFAAGKLDVGFFAVGAGKVTQVDAAVGGIRFLSIDPSPEAMARMRKSVPPSYAQMTKPRPGLAGVTEPVELMAYDYLMYAGDHVSEDTVYELTKSIAMNKADLAKSFGAFNGLNPEKMAKNIGLEFHPGAIRYYKEAGLWPSGS